MIDKELRRDLQETFDLFMELAGKKQWSASKQNKFIAVFDKLGSYDFIDLKFDKIIDKPASEKKPKRITFKDRASEFAEFTIDGMKFESLDPEFVRSAYSGTSMDPDKRALFDLEEFKRTTISQYENLAKKVPEDQKAQFQYAFKRFVNKYKDLKRDYLSTVSRSISPMVSGPSGFNSSRQEKVNRAESNKLDKLINFEDKALLRLKKEFDPAYQNKAIQGGQSDTITKLEEKLTKAKKAHEQMKDMNKILRSSNDPVKEITDKYRMPKDAVEEFVEEFEERKGYSSKGGFDLTNSNREIKRLEGRIEEEKRLESVKSDKTDKDFKFDGGEVWFDDADNRIRIQHDGVPDKETRDKLKQNGWRWSRKNQAWQRQITQNAINSAERLTGAKLT